jgi:cytochrome c-type biogenesis protein CcsB
MKRWLEALASLKLAVILLLLVAAVLAGATIVESTRGTEAAQAVYFSPWFLLLQGIFALNTALALVDRWPKNRWRIGFALTHGALLLILSGALVTWLGKAEGRMPLWEGQSSNLVLSGATGEEAPHELPFSIRLDAFEIDTYPGTRRPAMFRSRVVVLDPAGERPAIIEMNRPLAHGGWSFFQSSYQIRDGREMSILSVSRDPGQLPVFVGYTLLVVGMIVVFATRLAQQRAARANGARGAAAVVAVLVATGALGAAPAGAATVPGVGEVDELRALAVQHDGRTMPFDTQAREAVREVTGRRAWPGIDPVAMAAGWAIDPAGWQGEPIVKLRADVAEVAGIDGRRWASFAELVSNRALLERFARARERSQADEKLAPVDKHLLELETRLVTLDDYFRGEAIRAIPVAVAGEAWRPAPGRSVADWLDAGRRLRTSPPAGYPEAREIGRELVYNKVRPGRIAWWLLVPAALAAALTLGRERAPLGWIARAGTVGGFLVMSWGIWERWQIAGRIPASNMFESMLFLGWGVALFGVVSVVLRNRMLVFNAAAMAALAAALTDLLPMDPFIHPVPPVLAGTVWLAIHVPIIMLGYATLTIVTFFAHLVVGAEVFAPKRRDLIERWGQLAYNYTHVGSILLIAGILTGSIWAASSWGRYWGWDPKEVWSLVAFLAYMAILHARFDGQIRDFGVAVGSIVAYWTILMTYLGVNFVLASGLHSYGFGSSNLVKIMMLIAAAEVVFLAAGWAAVRRRRAAGEAG